jgi:hypothetical protein
MGHPWNASFHFTFLVLGSRYDSLDGGSARRKAATYTGQHKHRINAHTNTHASSGIWTLDPSVRASEDSSILRPRPLWLAHVVKEHIIIEASTASVEWLELCFRIWISRVQRPATLPVIITSELRKRASLIGHDKKWQFYDRVCILRGYSGQMLECYHKPIHYSYLPHHHQVIIYNYSTLYNLRSYSNATVSTHKSINSAV